MRRRGSLVAIVLCFVGCGEPQPPVKVFPASGKVLRRDGQPVGGGLVEFRSQEDPTLTINGVIQQDGTFTLKTLSEGHSFVGAAAGAYSVTVLAEPSHDPSIVQPVVEPIVLKESFTVQAADSNDFTIKLPK
jgi:hypothetical protein